MDRRLFPNLDQKGKNWDIHDIELAHGYRMWLIVRYGVKEALDFLSTFCNFYVYSHGFQEYIDTILDKIDPEQRWFKNREKTVLAPKN